MTRTHFRFFQRPPNENKQNLDLADLEAVMKSDYEYTLSSEKHSPVNNNQISIVHECNSAHNVERPTGLP